RHRNRSDFHRVYSEEDSRLKFVDCQTCASVSIGKVPAVAFCQDIIGVLLRRSFKLDTVSYDHSAQAIEKLRGGPKVFGRRLRRNEDMPRVVFVSTTLNQLHDMYPEGRLEGH